MTDREIELMRTLGSKVIAEEWKYFQKNARHYPNNKKSERYGILPMGAEMKESCMMYAKDTKELRRQHLEYINDNGINAGHRLRLFLDKLEKLEEKQ